MRNILERASKTIVEAFIGSLVITLPNADLTNKSMLYSIFIGAIATGLSALLNLILNYVDKKKVMKEI